MNRIGILVSSTLLAGIAGCTLRSDLPVYGRVPDFHLIRETGKYFDQTDVTGKVWVANFIFTTCTGPCPRMTSQMKQIQNSLARVPDVVLVSFTIDPERDTPQVLRDYAARFNADPSSWFFATGERPELRKLSKETFFLNDIGPPFDHSTRFVLIDRRGRIRGYYDSSNAKALEDLKKHIHALRRERI